MDIALTCGDWAGVRRSVAGLERFRRGRSYNPGVGGDAQDRFYDDNAWIGLDFIQALENSGQAHYLERAERVFAFLERGFSPNGSLYWNENTTAYLSWRNAATNGPALQLALHLVEETGKRRYLERAMQLDRFLSQELRTPEGLVYDGVTDDGFVDRRLWTYNQGTYIGASVQLYELTGDPEYLRRAAETASAGIAHFGVGDRLWRQPPAFNAIFSATSSTWTSSRRIRPTAPPSTST
jgi:predicted alpha-1,6-mannanase (GH76 family)